MSAEATQMPKTGRTGEMTLMSHLFELRSRLVKCIIAVALGAAAGWAIYFWVLDLLTEPLRDLSDNSETLFPNGEFLATDPLEPFSVRIKVSAYIGIMLAMPVIMWQLWRFIAPGLYKTEKRFAAAFVASSVVLFAAGAGIAYWTLPKALEFLQSMGGSEFVSGYTAQKYLMLIIYMMLAFGAGFEFPILLIFLQMVGIVKTAQLSHFRRWAYVLIAVLTAVITPSADPISMLSLMLPMWVFYEISIIAGKLLTKRKEKRQAAAEAAV